jgi:hypothetical protein
MNREVHDRQSYQRSSSQDIGELWPRNGSGLTLRWACRPKVPTRPNYSSQQAAPIHVDGRGGKQDDVAGVSVEELRDGGARMEQAANDGSSSTSMMITGLHMVVFDGSGMVLFKTKGASDRVLPAKNERRRWCSGSSLGKWRCQLQ